MLKATPSFFRVLGPIAGRAIVVLTPLGLIGFGARMIYEPLGFVVVGALLWVDVNFHHLWSDRKK